MSPLVRAMTPEDIAAARQLWADSEGVEVAEGDSPEELVSYLTRNPGVSTVATDPHGHLIGAVLCGHDGRRGFVYHLAVARAYRGQGIARAMMKRALSALKEEGLLRAVLLVDIDNLTGQQFWLREGWEEIPFARPMGLDL